MRAFTMAGLLLTLLVVSTACGPSDSSTAPAGVTADATTSPASEPSPTPSEAASDRSEPADAGDDEPADALVEGKPADASQRITLRRSLFTPEELQVKAGETVAWVNRDPYGHTVTFDPILDSGVLAGGGRYAVTFNEPGTYGFVCTVHPAIMSGEVTVKG